MIFVDKDGEPIPFTPPKPPCKHDWKVRHVDSVCAKCEAICEHGDTIGHLPWGNPHNYNQNHGGLEKIVDGETEYLQCVNCGRKFQLLHPVVAEAIIRDMQQEIDRLEGLFANV